MRGTSSLSSLAGRPRAQGAVLPGAEVGGICHSLPLCSHHPSQGGPLTAPSFRGLGLGSQGVSHILPFAFPSVQIKVIVLIDPRRPLLRRSCALPENQYRLLRASSSNHQIWTLARLRTTAPASWPSAFTWVGAGGGLLPPISLGKPPPSQSLRACVLALDSRTHGAGSAGAPGPRTATTLPEPSDQAGREGTPSLPWEKHVTFQNSRAFSHEWRHKGGSPETAINRPNFSIQSYFKPVSSCCLLSL